MRGSQTVLNANFQRNRQKSWPGRASDSDHVAASRALWRNAMLPSSPHEVVVRVRRSVNDAFILSTIDMKLSWEICREEEDKLMAVDVRASG